MDATRAGGLSFSTMGKNFFFVIPLHEGACASRASSSTLSTQPRLGITAHVLGNILQLCINARVFGATVDANVKN